MKLMVLIVIVLSLSHIITAEKRRKRQLSLEFGIPSLQSGNSSTQRPGADLGNLINNFLGGFLGRPQNQGQQHTARPIDFFNQFTQGFALNGQDCRNQNGGCEQGCRASRGRAQCYCNTGYVLRNDRRTCQDIDECRFSGQRLCEHKCTNTVGSYICSCAGRSVLLQDQKSCGPNVGSCSVNNGGCEQQCRESQGQILCSCSEGYELASDKKTCSDIDECASGISSCSPFQNCVNNFGSYECQSGSNAPSCAFGNGGCEHKCEDTIIGIKCSCRKNQVLNADGVTCSRKQGSNGGSSSNCNVNNGGCEQNCRNRRGRTRCSCYSGFQLKSDKKSCETAPSCDVNNGGCAHRCRVNRRGKRRCTCDRGYELLSDKKNCADVDECATGKHDCATQCVNTAGGFQCTNPTVTSQPVIGCSFNNGGCSDICQENANGVLCTCRPGFNLKEDGRTCSPPFIIESPCLVNNGGCDPATSDCVINRNTQLPECKCKNGFTLFSNGLCLRPIQPPPNPTPIITFPTAKPPPEPVSCGVNTKKSTFTTRIVGGRPADPKDWPWMAALLKARGKRQFCGGTLITDKHVLTASHCVYTLQPSELFVRLGEYDFKDPNENNPTDFRVVDIRMHGSYNSQTQENDIAILKLGRSSSFSEFIWPACLPPPNENFAQQRGYVTGWGTIDFGGAVSSVLLEVVLPVWDQKDCTKAYPDNVVADTMMCAGLRSGGKDSCQGDSGGPFLVQILPSSRWYVAGIVSWGKACARPENPGVYTRVNKYLDWIKENSS